MDEEGEKASVEDESDSDLQIRCPSIGGRRLKDQLLNLLLGQLLSLCLCGTAVSSQMLQDLGVDTPMAQSFLCYVMLALIFGTWIACQPGDANLLAVVRTRGWKYLILALFDVEANYLVVKAYHFTKLTSVQLLDCITIPLVLLLSFLFLRVRYLLTHVVGVVLCLLGIGCVVWADIEIGNGTKDPAGGGDKRWLGDIFCLTGASLYAVSNVGEEALVKHFTRSEFLGMIGLIGSAISGIQLSLVEKSALERVRWDSGKILGYYLMFAVCLVLFYSSVTYVMQRTSAAFYNLSILTSDFYTLLAGIFIFKHKFHYLYLVSFVCLLIGTAVYSLKATQTRGSSRPLDRASPLVEDIPVSPHVNATTSLLDTSPAHFPQPLLLPHHSVGPPGESPVLRNRSSTTPPAFASRPSPPPPPVRGHSFHRTHQTMGAPVFEDPRPDLPSYATHMARAVPPIGFDQGRPSSPGLTMANFGYQMQPTAVPPPGMSAGPFPVQPSSSYVTMNPMAIAPPAGDAAMVSSLQHAATIHSEPETTRITFAPGVVAIHDQEPLGQDHQGQPPVSILSARTRATSQPPGAFHTPPSYPISSQSKSLERPKGKSQSSYRRSSLHAPFIPDLTWRGKEQVRLVRYCPKHGTIIVDDPHHV